MTTPLTFPTTEQIAAALESLLDTAQRTYDQCDRHDAEERAFWRRQRNAYINAQADFLAGRVPLVAGDAYLMPSASRAGAYHRCWRAGGVWLCSCEAGEQGVFHRHTALISAIEYAVDLLDQGLVGELDTGDDGDDEPPPAAALAQEPSRAPIDAQRVASLVQRLSAARARLAA